MRVDPAPSCCKVPNHVSKRSIAARPNPMQPGSDGSACRGIAQPGRAPALGAGGRKFESCCPDQKLRTINTVITRKREAGSDMVARIYKPAKTAMQSGMAQTKCWVLDYEPERPRQVEPLMGWTSSSDMRSQIRLSFTSKDPETSGRGVAREGGDGHRAPAFDRGPRLLAVR